MVPFYRQAIFISAVFCIRISLTARYKHYPIYIFGVSVRYVAVLTKHEFGIKNVRSKRQFQVQNRTKLRPVGAELYHEDRKTDLNMQRFVLRKFCHLVENASYVFPSFTANISHKCVDIHSSFIHHLRKAPNKQTYGYTIRFVIWCNFHM